MKIYFAGCTNTLKMEKEVIKRGKNRLLSYHFIKKGGQEHKKFNATKKKYRK